MQTLKYFEQEGGIYHLKVQKGLFYTISVLGFGAMIATLIYGTTKGAYMGAALLAFIVVMGILRSTGKISFDTQSRKIRKQSFFFSSEITYNFDDFDYFLISKLKSAFITVGVSAVLVMYVNGKTKNILLRQSFFTARPLQRLNDELSSIMGLSD
ncbi:hypothetical protein [Pedobacter caeni]|uniref:Uncharacterized protein n=1 Tax=Pedobacter caeni TaxID=288992 RepID=A0A1M5AT43_9SPHI|nr:hypothetical protein [Pedobacter caeni]SHF33400.1 hypothetical protein SAMN04488522_102877 [Pedobacter caeni]